MTISGQNFEMYQGDSKEIQITVADEDGNILDLSSYTDIVWVAYHPTTKNAVLTKTMGDGITVPAPSNGIIVIALAPEDTLNIPPLVYNHECEISDGGPVVSTVATGIVKILYSKA